MLLAIEWKNQRKIWMNQTGKNNCRCQEKVLVVNQLYVDYQDLSDETRVSHAEMYINEYDIKKYKRIFKILLEHSISKSEITELFNQLDTKMI